MSAPVSESQRTVTSRQRPIRSFVRREGRLTAGQRHALDELYPCYGVPVSDSPIDMAAIFGRTAPIILDVGFGNGEALAELARYHPERNYLGIEVYRSGIGRLLRQLEDQQIGNVRVMDGDAVTALRQRIPAASLSGLQLFFPDPWPKKRHHKRRMVQHEWLALVTSRLANQGFLHLATDWRDYAEHMLAVVSANPTLHNPHSGFAPDRGGRPATKFEHRGLRRGHGVWDLIAQRSTRA